jgi:hypothetical protein
MHWSYADLMELDPYAYDLLVEWLNEQFDERTKGG